MKTFLFRSDAGIDHYMIEEDGKTRFAAYGDVSPIIEQNKTQANLNDGYTPSREMRRVASIPYAVGLQWYNEEGWWFEDPQYADRLAKKLNDPDWRHLRTAEGRVGLTNGRIR